MHTLSLAARCRASSNSVTLANALAKIQAAREYGHAPIYALSSQWKEGEIFEPFMVHNTLETYEIVCRLDYAVKIDDSPHGEAQRLPRPSSARKSESRTLPDLPVSVALYRFFFK